MLKNEPFLEDDVKEEKVANDPGNTTFTDEEIASANKPQANVILSKNDNDESTTSSNTYRDTGRVAPRANEAADSSDTNTGGMPAGGAKGASQS